MHHLNILIPQKWSLDLYKLNNMHMKAVVSSPIEKSFICIIRYRLKKRQLRIKSNYLRDPK